MYDDGYRHISNIDYSPVVIDKMAAANADCDGMTWTVGDIRALPFADGSVDVCIDKATMDAMLTGEKDPWVRCVRARRSSLLPTALVCSARLALPAGLLTCALFFKRQNPPPEAVADCRAEVDEVVRVLRPDGIFLYLCVRAFFSPVPSSPSQPH